MDVCKKVETGENKMKVLLFDTENFPNLVFTWGIFEQDVIKVVRPKMVCSIAWNWLGESKIHVRTLASYRGYKKDLYNNYKLMQEFHKQMMKADIVIGYNGDKFDIRMVNTEFLRHKMKPLPPFKSVDPLKVNRAKFSFNSNKMDAIAEELGLPRKKKHEGFTLWEKCYYGDMKAWKRMEAYNKQDVPVLKAIYLRVRPWMTNHPNMNALDGHLGCTVCKSTNFHKRGQVIVGGGFKHRYQCQDCFKWFQGSWHKSGWKFR